MARNPSSEARRDEVAKRLAAKQAEKDRYVRTYAQGYISEEELDVYLADLKNQTDNLRLLLESIEAERSQRREQAELAETTEVWLQTLWERVKEVEGDTPEAFQKRRQLVRLLVQSISADKRPEDGRTEIQITYRFGPPPDEGYSDGSAGGEEDSFVVPLQNGRTS
jgi:septal ring factor EnvC (AmiA/AmiB activator)